jgi:hypothetical protein
VVWKSVEQGGCQQFETAASAAGLSLAEGKLPSLEEFQRREEMSSHLHD